jgi:hypothetical protein
MIEPPVEGGISTTIVGVSATLGGIILGWLSFWMGFERRLTKAELTAQNALQVAAEAAEEVKEMREQSNNLQRNFTDALDGLRREFGETARAALQKIHEIETWSRDTFVREPQFTAALLRMENSQDARDKRLDDRLSRIEDKLDVIQEDKK